MCAPKRYDPLATTYFVALGAFILLQIFLLLDWLF